MGVQQVQETSLAGHRLSQRGGHLCWDGQPKAQPPRKRRAPRCWQSFRKLSEIGNGSRHRTSDGWLDLRANKPADQDKHGQRDPYGEVASRPASTRTRIISVPMTLWV